MGLRSCAGLDMATEGSLCAVKKMLANTYETTSQAPRGNHVVLDTQLVLGGQNVCFLLLASPARRPHNLPLHTLKLPNPPKYARPQ